MKPHNHQGCRIISARMYEDGTGWASKSKYNHVQHCGIVRCFLLTNKVFKSRKSEASSASHVTIQFNSSIKLTKRTECPTHMPNLIHTSPPDPTTPRQSSISQDQKTTIKTSRRKEMDIPIQTRCTRKKTKNRKQNPAPAPIQSISFYFH